MVFAEGVLPEELTWATMFLLPKLKGGCWDIGLVEATWKVCAVVLNSRLKKWVELHDSLNGFWEVHGDKDGNVRGQFGSTVGRPGS